MPSKSSRIQHVVVLMLENRSFDHIFGYRRGVNGLKGDEFNLLNPAKPESESNPAFRVSNGAPYGVTVGEGPGHSFNAANEQLCANKLGPGKSSPPLNNGFAASYRTELIFADKVKNATPADIRVGMESFAPSMLPSINALADAFCLCDHWYSEVPGPTQPNRLYIHAASSFGYVHNVWGNHFDARTIYNSLQDAGVTWATYDFDQNEILEFTQAASEKASFKLFEDDFAADVKSGRLANYSFIVPRFLNKGDDLANSQHAPQDARYGDSLIADVYDTLRSNPDVWMQSVLIVTYDEHGGFYDHVIPPSKGVANPDGIDSPPPRDNASWVPKFAFDRLGFRVPAIVASPWVAAGIVDSTPYQHTSVLATLKNLYGLPKFLTKRDAQANPFDALFQKAARPRTDTPPKLPRVPLPKIEASKDDPAHPANQPLDETQKEIVHGVHRLTAASHPKGPSIETLPKTQGEAADHIRKRYRRHFGRK
jgi:phospholipase C